MKHRPKDILNLKVCLAWILIDLEPNRLDWTLSYDLFIFLISAHDLSCNRLGRMIGSINDSSYSSLNVYYNYIKTNKIQHGRCIFKVFIEKLIFLD